MNIAMLSKELTHDRSLRIVQPFIEYMIIIAVFVFFFANAMQSDYLLGDSGDALYCDLICEYWFQFFSGNCGFNELCTFFPVSNTLGYSDMQLGFGLIYSVFRLLGCDIFLAGEYSMLFVFLLGYIAFFTLLRHSFKLKFASSAVGSIAAYFSSAILYSFSHMQMLFITLFPLLILLLFVFWKNREDKNGGKLKRLAAGTGVVAFIGLTFFTAFYAGYFLCITLFILAICYFFFGRLVGRKPCKTLYEFIRAHRIESIWYAISNAFWVVPFLIMYIPILKQFGNRSSDQMLVHSPRPIEIIHDTGSSALSSFINSIFGFNMNVGETFYGFNLIHFGIVCIAVAIIVKSFLLVMNNEKRCKGSRNTLIWALCAICTMIVIVLVVTKFGSFSIWTTVMQLMPGASAIRAVGRFMMVVVLLSGFVIACGFENLFFKVPKTSYAAVILISILILWQAYSAIPLRWLYSEQRAIVENAANIPEQCEILLIDYDEAQGGITPALQQKAWLIATSFGVQTINGNSGQAPKGWDLFFVDKEKYYETISTWISRHEIDESTVYIYNENSRHWLPWSTVSR